MTSYKELYLEMQKKLRELENQCIDLRNVYPGKIFKFDKDKWKLTENTNQVIVIEKL